MTEPTTPLELPAPEASAPSSSASGVTFSVTKVVRQGQEAAYDAILLVSPKRADDQAFLAALRPLVGAIDVGVMREANRRASTGATPEVVARWLDEKIGR